MRANFILVTAVGLFSASLAGQSIACMPSQYPRPDRETALSAFRSAAAVVDVDVIDLGGSDWNGWVTMRPLNVWKGPRQASYRLTVQSSCDIGSEDFQIGGRYRLLLQHNSEGYHADRGDNGQLGLDVGAFIAEVDRLLGSRRPRNFKLCACQPAPPGPNTRSSRKQH